MVFLKKAALDDSQISSRSLLRQLVLVLEHLVLHICPSFAELRERGVRTKLVDFSAALGSLLTRDHCGAMIAGAMMKTKPSA